MKRARFSMISLAACLLMAAPALAADEQDQANATVGGTIPELCQIDIVNTGADSLLTLTQDGTGENAYDDGYVQSTTTASVLTLDANKQWKLAVKSNNWTCPGSYDKAESDLSLKITNSPTGTIQNSFNNFVSPTATDVNMLTHTAGVSDNDVDIQYKVLLDWTKDLPGAYSITVTYTMATATP